MNYSASPGHTAPYFDPRAESGRPLDLLVLGAALTLGTLAAILYIAYKAWYLGEIGEDRALFVCGLLFFIYAAGAYIFSYAWCRRDAGQAVRLMVVIVVLSAALVLFAAVAMALLSKSKGIGGSGDSASEAGSDGFGGVLGVAGTFIDDGRVDFGREKKEPESAWSTLTCHSCGERYIPMPPRAICPSCGWAAVSAG